MASAKEMIKALVTHLARQNNWELVSSSKGHALDYRGVIRVRFSEKSGAISIKLEPLNPKSSTNATYMRGAQHALQQAFGVVAAEVFGVRIEET